MQYWKPLSQILIWSAVSLVAGCGGGSTSSSTNKVSPTATDSSSSSQTTTTQLATNGQASSSSSAATNSASSTLIAGTISYDRVLFEGRSYRGLDYDKTIATAARGVVVQLVNTQEQVLASTVTDSQGRYEMSAPSNTSVQIRVLAELASANSNAQWSIDVKDNTNGNAPYVLEGSFAEIGDEAQLRDLHAASGWNGYEYSATRSAAPFAVLDSIYDAVKLVVDAEPSIVLPPLTVYWSEDNIAIAGSIADGHISTSYYTSAGPSIYLLGAANNDSDEYDRAVIQHEFGHYLEHQLARTESLGGSHSQSSRLDLRVAFGEAWGNAFAGMASGDSVYRDSFGGSQSLAFAIDVEKRGFGNQGWFSESTIQALLYDLFDDADDGGDPIALGFKPIFNVLTSSDYLDFAGFASIYPFVDVLKSQQPAVANNISALMVANNIFGEGGYAEGETNNGGSDITLPIYQRLLVDGSVTLCSDSDYQDYNGMDVRSFARVDLPSNRNYRIVASKISGLASGNPQIRIFQKGQEVGSLRSSTRDTEQGQSYLNAGTYIIELYDEANVDGNSDNSGLVCYSLSIY